MLIKQFQAISLSHRTASVSVRERAALNEKQTRYILSQVRDLAGIQEILILSTCNRTEIYYNSAEDHSFLLIRMLAIAQHKISYCEIAENATFINDHDDAARHLFRVAMGLDSQVIGDLQISHQVKNAYQWSADAQLAGPFLHRLMHTIFFTNKRVTQETEFRDGAASVSYAAAELANDLSKTWVEPQVLVIGLGEMGSDVARNLKNFSLKNVTLANRTFEKAEKLATECNFNAIPLNKVHQSLIDYDIVISAIASPEPFLKKEH
ncbi:MAG: glutamyl-tRNA reductase, partial [Bacteroidota bacterium]